MIKHGTLNGYNYYGCRCEPCSTTKKTYMRTWRARDTWRQRNPEAARRRSRIDAWRRYGMDPKEAEAALLKHGGLCDYCETTAPGGRGDWHVDHDHETGRVRGILCARCNAQDRLGGQKCRD